VTGTSHRLRWSTMLVDPGFSALPHCVFPSRLRSPVRIRLFALCPIHPTRRIPTVSTPPDEKNESDDNAAEYDDPSCCPNSSFSSSAWSTDRCRRGFAKERRSDARSVGGGGYESVLRSGAVHAGLTWRSAGGDGESDLGRGSLVKLSSPRQAARRCCCVRNGGGG
jgi:hypothetical protein